MLLPPLLWLPSLPVSLGAGGDLPAVPTKDRASPLGRKGEVASGCAVPRVRLGHGWAQRSRGPATSWSCLLVCADPGSGELQ